MKRLACLAVLCGTAFAATPALAATASSPESVSASGVEAAPPNDPRLRRMLLLVADKRFTVLICDPGQVHRSTHPKARQACDALAAVDGVPGRLKQAGTIMCTMESDPVPVSAIGTWDGRLSMHMRTYGNRCELGVSTGPVFDF
ncbi:SSI family serine proteinase inhibitor [Nonomuraea recticatena]|uniref:Subtilisin inhibitor domain-containing protein n=2 Tax=Nonomuraea recticatena TaxID=46178 RepID=A0ABN3RXH1_9ACTN